MKAWHYSSMFLDNTGSDSDLLREIILIFNSGVPIILKTIIDLGIHIWKTKSCLIKNDS